MSKDILMVYSERRGRTVYGVNVFDTKQNRFLIDQITSLEELINELKDKLDVEYTSHTLGEKTNEENDM